MPTNSNRKSTGVIKMRGDHLLPKDLVSFVPACENAVEVGVYTGEVTVFFAASGKFRQVWAVDPWHNGYDDSDGASDSDMGSVELAFDNRIATWPMITKLKMTSIEAASRFPDGYFGLVYIDACHQFEAVCEDINAWLPKVKPGGVLAGHDYLSFGGVKKAVDELLIGPDRLFDELSWAKMV